MQELKQQENLPAGWERVACPACNAADCQPELTLPGNGNDPPYRLVRCRNCDLVYLNPRPDARTIGRYYPEDYLPYQQKQPRRGPFRQFSQYVAGLVRTRFLGYPRQRLTRWEVLLAYLALPWAMFREYSMTDLPFVGEGKLLDFGCGSGWYAARMRDRGWQVVGMDFTESSARKVESRYGFPVLVGSLPHPEVPEDSYDVITMGAVLEHVHDPHAVLAAAWKALKPGGLLLVSVPNYEGWSRRAFGRHWYGLELPRHLLHFSAVTLRRIVEGHGFSLSYCKTIARPSWIKRSISLVDAGSDRNFAAFACRLRPIRSLIARCTMWTGQADALCLLAKKVTAAATENNRRSA